VQSVRRVDAHDADLFPLEDAAEVGERDRQPRAKLRRETLGRLAGARRDRAKLGSRDSPQGLGVGTGDVSRADEGDAGGAQS
jgi:hypothetical protein